MGPPPARVVLLTGTVGTGKTTVAVEVGRQLEADGEPCAVVDLDWLGWINAGASFRAYDELIAQNLSATWPNFAAAGARSLVLARAILRRDALEALRALFPGSRFSVVRLTASPATIRARLAARDAGAALEEHLAEAGAMAALIDTAALHDVSVCNEGAEPQEVARRVIAFAFRDSAAAPPVPASS